MENGTVLHYAQLHPELDVIHMILGIAEGVGYLHDKGVIHSDLKSDNVLISQLGEPLICDFGISRMISISQSMGGQGAHVQNSTSTLRGSSRWMSPELLMPPDNQPTVHSKSSDAWAFGMTTYELLTKRRPYHQLISDPQVLTAIMRGRLPDKPDSFDNWPSHYHGAWNLCKACWLKEPSTRPRMGHIIMRLKDMVSELVSPSLDSLISPHVPATPVGPDRTSSDISLETPSTAARELALRESLSSGKMYASDLPFMQSMHVPMAQRQEVPLSGLATPPRSSESSLHKLSTSSEPSPKSIHYGLPMTRSEDKLLEVSERGRDIPDDPQRHSKLQVVANLEARVEDWHGHHLSKFGELVLDDIFMVAKADTEREYHVFLFEKLILCCKEVLPVFKKLAMSLTGGMSSSRNKTTPLVIKGRIFLSTVTHTRPRITNGVAKPQHSLQIWWRDAEGVDGIDHLSLGCQSGEQLDVWENAVNRLTEKMRMHAATESRLNLTELQSGSINSSSSMLPQLSSMVTMKVHYLDDIFVVQVPRTMEYEELVAKVEKKVRFLGPARDDGPLKLRYIDGEGDMVSLGSTEDVQMAIESMQFSNHMALFVS